MLVDKYTTTFTAISGDKVRVIALRKRLKTTKLLHYRAKVLWAGEFDINKPFSRYHGLLEWCKERSTKEDVTRELVCLFVYLNRVTIKNN